MSNRFKSSNKSDKPSFSLEKFSTTLRADFRFAPINALILVSIFVVGFIVHLQLHDYSIEAVSICLGSALILAIFFKDNPSLGSGSGTGNP